MLKNSRTKRIGKELVWVTTGQVAVVLGTLLGVKVLTSFLTPSVYGELTLALTVTAFFGQLIMGPLSNGIARFYSAAREASQLYEYFLAVRALMFRATLGLFLFSLLLIAICVFYKKTEWLELALLAMSFALFSGYNTVLTGIQNAARQRGVVALHQALVTWTRFGFAVGLIIVFQANSIIAMTGYNLSMFIVTCSQLVFFNRVYKKTSVSLKEKIKPKKWKIKILTYSWPFATWGIFTWAQIVSDRWALEIFGSTHDVGLYVVVYQLGYYPISLATNLFIQLVSPIFAQRAGDASDAQRMNNVYILNWRLTLIALFLTVVSFMVTWQFHDFIFRVLVAKEFSEVSFLLPWMTLAGGLFATGQSASISAAMSANTKSLLLPKISTAILGVCLNYLGASHYGIVGVVAAHVAFSSVYLIWILLLNAIKHKKIKQQL